MESILKSTKKIAEQIKSLGSVDEKIDLINQVRALIHEVSPLKHHPVDCVFWEKALDVEANEYNPNSVAPPEQELLETSIIEDGYTMPELPMFSLDGMSGDTSIMEMSTMLNSMMGMLQQQ